MRGELTDADSIGVARRNGDVLRLTITALRTNPILGVDPFIVLSTYGAPDQIDFRGHVAMGLVFTN